MTEESQKLRVRIALTEEQSTDPHEPGFQTFEVDELVSGPGINVSQISPGVWEIGLWAMQAGSICGWNANGEYSNFWPMEESFFPTDGGTLRTRAAGAETQMQYNLEGAFGADAGFTRDPSNNFRTVIQSGTETHHGFIHAEEDGSIVLDAMGPVRDNYLNMATNGAGISLVANDKQTCSDGLAFNGAGHASIYSIRGSDNKFSSIELSCDDWIDIYQKLGDDISKIRVRTNRIEMSSGPAVSLKVDADSSSVSVEADGAFNALARVIRIGEYAGAFNNTCMIISDQNGLMDLSAKRLRIGGGVSEDGVLVSEYGQDHDLSDGFDGVRHLFFAGASGESHVILPDEYHSQHDVITVSDLGFACQSNEIVLDAGTGYTIVSEHGAFQTYVLSKSGSSVTLIRATPTQWKVI